MPALRSGFLVCSFCVLALLLQSLPAQANPENALTDAAIRFLRKAIHGQDEKIAKQTEKSISQETIQSKKAYERTIRTIETHPEAGNDPVVIWDVADDAVKKRAQTEATELEHASNEEADRIAKEEKLSEECAEKVASAFKKTVCFCVRQKLLKRSFPDDAAAARFVEGAFDAATECGFSRLAYRISRGANATVAKVLAPATKALGKSIASAAGAERAQKSESSDETNEGVLFGLLYLMCKDK